MQDFEIFFVLEKQMRSHLAICPPAGHRKEYPAGTDACPQASGGQGNWMLISFGLIILFIAVLKSRKIALGS